MKSKNLTENLEPSGRVSLAKSALTNIAAYRKDSSNFIKNYSTYTVKKEDNKEKDFKSSKTEGLARAKRDSTQFSLKKQNTFNPRNEKKKLSGEKHQSKVFVKKNSIAELLKQQRLIKDKEYKSNDISLSC